MSVHEPVLTAEALTFLAPERGGLFVDCTVGLGGHTRALLEAGATRVIGLDRDRDALDVAAADLRRSAIAPSSSMPIYRSLAEVLLLAASRRSMALADLGVSSLQIDAKGAGSASAATRRWTCAWIAVPARLPPIRERDAGGRLADIIFRFGEERHSRRIARAIVEARRRGPIATTGQLAATVRRAVPTHGWQRIDPATRTFQALRIWVNLRLEGLDALPARRGGPAPGRRCVVVISFHSLEDRIVKHTFRALERAEAIVKVLTKRPARARRGGAGPEPSRAERKLRAAERGWRSRPEAHDGSVRLRDQQGHPNNQVVREIDHLRQRELWRWAVVGSVILSLFVYLRGSTSIRCVTGIGWSRWSGARKRRSTAGCASQIQLLRSPQRIAGIAARQLRMVEPAAADAVVLERAVPADPPSASVVARR